MTEFYDRAYRSNPNKWSGGGRDEFAFQALSRRIAQPAALLDFGCGNGHTIRFFMDRWSDTTYYGVDTSRVALEIAHKKVPTAFLVESADVVPYVNVIIMLGVLEHFEDLSGIRSVADHLAPGGIMYVEIPNCLSYSNSKAEGWRKTTGGTGQTEWHLRRESWERILTKNGLYIVERLTGRNPAWEFVWILQ